MFPSIRRPLITAATVLVLAGPSSAQTAGRCSSETLTIDGQRVGAMFCVIDQKSAGNGRSVRVTLSESLSAAGGALKRNSILEFVASDPARAIDDIPLAALGIKKTLHSTFVSSGGNVRLEHALLVPGAVTVK